MSNSVNTNSLASNASNPNPDISSLTTLQLGDIISFDAPVNPDLHDRIFLIKYIDGEQITLIDEEKLTEQVLLIDDEGNLTDQSVEAISILDRVDTPSYAKQNNLLPGKWINVRFGGDIPVIVTGVITDLEEDMIEIRTHPDGDTIYIDFAYKGIPKDLPIEKIEIRETPASARKLRIEEDEGESKGESEGVDEGEGADGEDDDETVVASRKSASSRDEVADEYNRDYVSPFDVEEIAQENVNIDVDVPVSNVKDQLREMLLSADQIQIGDDLGAIEQEVDIVDGVVRYGLEKQVNDMLDEMLSTIPNAQRTQTVLNSIHQMIDRFIQLREQFSNFDEHGNASAPKFHGPTYKPIVAEMMKLNNNIMWLLPIAKNRKKLFQSPDDIDTEKDDITGNEDYVSVTMYDHENTISDILTAFKDNAVSDGQNKYDYMIQRLTPAMQSFMQPRENDDDYIDMRSVGVGLTALIGNMEDFYSSVVQKANITKQRFVISKYELGENKLRQTRLRNGKLDIQRVPITAPQNIAIKGFLTLPETVSSFSRVNMPRTNIMMRAELSRHYLSYWQILRRKTGVQNTIIDNLDEQVDYDKATFLSNVRSYMLDESIEDADKYEKFLEAIMPKTRVLFELVKRHIKNAYSLYSILDYLEPFYVYHGDLSFKQYEAMTGYIRGQIKNYKKTLAEARKEFIYIQSLGENARIDTKLLNMLGLNEDEEDVLLRNYDIIFPATNPTEQNAQFAVASTETIEQLHKMSMTDNAKTYTSSLALSMVDLMVPDGELLEDLNEDIQEAQRELYSAAAASSEANGQPCNKYVIAKKYISLDELEADNNEDVYFDRKYDRTDYGLLKKFDREKRDMGANFLTFLARHIADMKPTLGEYEAEREARAIIEGKRIVEDGDFAVLITDGDVGAGNGDAGDGEMSLPGFDNHNIQNYVRKQGRWELSDVKDNLLPTVDLGAFCAAKEKCIPSNSECDDAGAKSAQSEISTLKESIKFFAELYPKQREKMRAYIEKRVRNAVANQENRKMITYKDLTKYTRNKYILGEDAKGSDVQESPYAPLRDLILSQGDFMKKQYDIVRFAQRFTFARDENAVVGAGVGADTTNSDNYWQFCNITGVKLLPSFMYYLANSFISYPDEYINAIEYVCTNQGTLSDDGEHWVDKHSGYVICPIQYDTEEGFTAQGFKMKTRSQMESDKGDIVLMNADGSGNGKEKAREFEGEEANMVANAARALAGLMSVNINTQLEFIVRNVLIMQPKTMPNEETYNRLMEKAAKQQGQKKTKQVSYEDAYNANLLYLMFCYFIVGLQTAMPDIKTNKTFPGCKRAFGGYPIDGNTDMSAVTYIACLVQQLKKSRSQPWKAIASANEITIIKKMQGIIDRYLIVDDEIQKRFADKREYLLINKSVSGDNDIPLEHDISKWTNFLPALITPEISKLQPLSKDFPSKLLSEMKKGAKEQFRMKAYAIARMMQYSVGIQTLIHKVVATHKLLLVNSSNEPFLQNACCETVAPICLQYFVEKQPEIAHYNGIIKEISDLLIGMSLTARAPFLFDPRDTKTLYPDVAGGFTENTIYQAIVTYCRFNSPLPTPESLIPICQDKPTDINVNDDMATIVSQLKQTGRVYTRETLDAIMAQVNKENIVRVELDKPIDVNVQALRDTLEMINDMAVCVVSKDTVQSLINILSVFNVKYKKGGDDTELRSEVRRLRNALSSLTTENNEKTENFLAKYGPKLTRTVKKNMLEFLKAPTNLPETSATSLLTEKENAMYRNLSFAKKMARNMVYVIPNMIINKVVKTTTTPTVHDHWGLSKKHADDIVSFVKKYYEGLTKFYDEKAIEVAMNMYIAKYSIVVKLMDALVYLAPMPGDDTTTLLDDITVQGLIDYYLSLLIAGFAEVTTDPSVMQTNIAEKVSVSASDEMSEGTSSQMMGIDEDADMIALMRGERQQLQEKMANLMIEVINVMKDERSTLDYSFDTVNERVHRIREHEKDLIVQRLGNMTDEEREIEDNFKRAKLGVWSKGLKKGVFQYAADDYDEEREAMEKQIVLERRAGKVHQVTDMNREIYMSELEEEDRVAAEIEDDAYDMSNIGEDDDDGFDPDD